MRIPTIFLCIPRVGIIGQVQAGFNKFLGPMTNMPKMPKSVIGPLGVSLEGVVALEKFLDVPVDLTLIGEHHIEEPDGSKQAAYHV